jgi:hypothetical protein
MYFKSFSVENRVKGHGSRVTADCYRLQVPGTEYVAGYEFWVAGYRTRFEL